MGWDTSAIFAVGFIAGFGLAITIGMAKDWRETLYGTFAAPKAPTAAAPLKRKPAKKGKGSVVVRATKKAAKRHAKRKAA